MDWFGTLIKATKDYFSTNGLVILIVIVLTASITTILGYAIPAFGKFMRYSPQRIWRAGKVFKKWYYWTRYHPKYTFVNMSPAVINETTPALDGFNTEPAYKITIEMRLCIYNNDDLNNLFLDCAQGKMSLRLYSKTEKRAKCKLFFSSPYTLYKVVAHKEKLFDFFLTTDQIDIKPKVGDEAHCDNISIGIAQLTRMNYELKGNPFDVKVDWSKIQLHGDSK